MSFAKGGVLLATTSNVVKGATLDVAIGTREYDPYLHRDIFDVEVANRMRTCGPMTPLEVTKLTKDEAHSLLKFYDEAGVMFCKPYITKAVHKTSLELKEQAVTEPVHDEAELFEKAVQNHYSVLGGNPGFMLKSVSFTY